MSGGRLERMVDERKATEWAGENRLSVYCNPMCAWLERPPAGSVDTTGLVNSYLYKLPADISDTDQCPGRDFQLRHSIPAKPYAPTNDLAPTRVFSSRQDGLDCSASTPLARSKIQLMRHYPALRAYIHRSYHVGSIDLHCSAQSLFFDFSIFLAFHQWIHCFCCCCFFCFFLFFL